MKKRKIIGAVALLFIIVVVVCTIRNPRIELIEEDISSVQVKVYPGNDNGFECRYESGWCFFY